MNDTRPATTFSQEQLRELAREVRRQGGSISIREDGLSKVQSWLNLTIGSIAIVVGGWAVKSINDLTVQMGRVATQYEYLRDDVRDLKTEFRSHVNETVRVPPDLREKR